MPSPLLLLALGAIGAATYITLAVARPLIEESMENAGVETTYEI